MRASQRLARSLLGRKLIIGVDRLDYTKGITERLRAYETLLQNYPRQRGQVTFVQISAPSREEVPEYLEMRRQVEATSGRINGRFSEFDWMPLRYLNRSFSRRTLSGFFRLSRIGLVTPLRDGMNWSPRSMSRRSQRMIPAFWSCRASLAPPMSWTVRWSSIRTIPKRSPRRCISA